MTRKAVLLDTSFFIRFLNDTDTYFEAANGYYTYLIKNGYDLVISTISIAEYCVRGSVSELPLKNLQVLPFNYKHGQKAGELARLVFDAKKEGALIVNERLLIPNDAKLFAQADVEERIEYYLTSDTRSSSIFKKINSLQRLSFQLVDLTEVKHTQLFGVLDI